MVKAKLDKKSALLVGFGLFIYYTLPPITAISIDKFSIRFADFNLLILICICAPIIVNFLNHKKILIFAPLLFAFGLAWGWQYNGPIQALYLLRLVQYFLMGIVIFYFSKTDYFHRWVQLTLLVQGIWSTLQYLKYVPVFDTVRGDYFHTTFSGTFGNTAELSYFVFFIMVLFQVRYTFIFTLIGGLIFLNGVVMPAIATMSLSLRRFYSLCPPIVLIILIFTIIGSSFYFMTVPGVLSDAATRYAALEDFVLLKGVGLQDQDFRFNIDLLKSVEIRINKFFGLFLGWKADDGVMLFGCGYGCGYGAVDSGVYRFILEFGIFGALCFLFVIRKLNRQYLIAIILGNILFDAFWSSATAGLVWAIIFHALDSQKSATSQNCSNHRTDKNLESI